MIKIELKYILYILFFIIGIILYISNNKDNFQVGGIIRIIDKNLNVVCDDSGTRLEEYENVNDSIEGAMEYDNYTFIRNLENNNTKLILGILNSDLISQNLFSESELVIPSIDNICKYKGSSYYNLFYGAPLYQLLKYFYFFLSFNTERLIPPYPYVDNWDFSNIEHWINEEFDEVEKEPLFNIIQKMDRKNKDKVNGEILRRAYNTGMESMKTRTYSNPNIMKEIFGKEFIQRLKELKHDVGASESTKRMYKDFSKSINKYFFEKLRSLFENVHNYKYNIRYMEERVKDRAITWLKTLTEVSSELLRKEHCGSSANSCEKFKKEYINHETYQEKIKKEYPLYFNRYLMSLLKEEEDPEIIGIDSTGKKITVDHLTEMAKKGFYEYNQYLNNEMNLKGTYFNTLINKYIIARFLKGFNLNLDFEYVPEYNNDIKIKDYCEISESQRSSDESKISIRSRECTQDGDEIDEVIYSTKIRELTKFISLYTLHIFVTLNLQHISVKTMLDNLFSKYSKIEFYSKYYINETIQTEILKRVLLKQIWESIFYQIPQQLDPDHILIVKSIQKFYKDIKEKYRDVLETYNKANIELLKVEKEIESEIEVRGEVGDDELEELMSYYSIDRFRKIYDDSMGESIDERFAVFMSINYIFFWPEDDWWIRNPQDWSYIKYLNNITLYSFIYNYFKDNNIDFDPKQFELYIKAYLYIMKIGVDNFKFLMADQKIKYNNRIIGDVILSNGGNLEFYWDESDFKKTIITQIDHATRSAFGQQ